MLDLPAARHLLDNKFGIHPHRDVSGPELGSSCERRDETPVFGHVVGGHPERLFAFRENRRVVGVEHHRPVTGRTGVAA